MKLDTEFFDKLLISGKSRKDLLNEEINIGGEPLVIGRMKNKQIKKVMKKVSEQDWNIEDTAGIVAMIYDLFPSHDPVCKICKK